jgi:hypothetical protein
MLSVNPVHPALQPHIRVVPFGDASYNSILERLYPGAASLSVLQPVLPYSIILQNTSSAPILGTSVLFTVTGAKTLRYAFNTYDPDAESPALLLPGWYRFVSVIPPANQAVLENDTRPMLTPRAVTLDTVISDLRSSPRVAVSVEAVITSRGLFLGPDGANLLNRITAEQRAEAFLAAGLQSIGPAAPQKAVQWLTPFASAPPARTGNPFADDFYNRKLYELAKLILGRLNRGDPNAVSGYLLRFGRRVTVTAP